MKFTLVLVTTLVGSVSAHPYSNDRHAHFDLKNGQDAIALNQKFKTLKNGDACNEGDVVCAGDMFAQCVYGKLLARSCAPGTQCAALPRVHVPGTAIACTTPDDIARRIAITGATGAGYATNDGDTNDHHHQHHGSGHNEHSGGSSGSNTNSGNHENNKGSGSYNHGNSNGSGGGNSKHNDCDCRGGQHNASNADPQKSHTLDPRVIATGFADDGQGQPAAGQVASKTSTNNFINFCLTVPSLPITNGKQITTGSCNPAPMGVIPAVQNMPSCKFTSPKNMDTIPANTAFNISMAIKNLQTGFFTNAEGNFFGAPQQLSDQGLIQGHSHVVIEQIESITQTTPTDPQKFAFFKGLNSVAQDGILTAAVTSGLPKGTYRLASINTASNHQPVLVPVAQHGALDDIIYFTVA